jgi:arginine decarboxylase
MLTPIIKMNLRDAYFSTKEIIPKSEAVGRLSGEVVAECPPGISILLPGELITEAHLPYLTDYDVIEVLKI